MEARVQYVSSAVNQTQQGLHWGPHHTICYAASTGVLLCDPKKGQVTGSSSKVHSKRVRCVKWVQLGAGASWCIVSAGADGNAVIWKVSEEKVENLNVLNPFVVIGHGEALSLAAATPLLHEGQQKLLLVTVTTDTLHTWLVSLQAGSYESKGSLSLPGRAFIMSLDVFEVAGATFPVVACGGHDSRIHILSARDAGVYETVAVLSGHEDWVTSLQAMTQDSGGLLLASGSKDASVRLWKLSVVEEKEQDQESLAPQRELQLKSVRFSVQGDAGDLVVSASLDAVLAGHEGLVSQVCWARPILKEAKLHQPYRLLTCSKTQDRCLIIWEPEEGSSSGSGVWLETARLGEVGGNLEGYYGAQFSPDGSQVIGYSYQGALHLWQLEGGAWQPCVVAGGHFDQVADIAWAVHGRYLLSSSKDQTTRLHGPWQTTNKEVVWHEIGRPQVHGYDMACLASLGKYKFASGAEEKVIRGFVAPANFIRNFGQICGIDVGEDLEECMVGEGASVPSLGLSNKAVLQADLVEEQQVLARGVEEVQAYFKPLSLFAPPTEDQLMQNTLWPEAAKLYGHGNDMMALAASPDGAVLASSCRATSSLDALIILWNTNTWQKIEGVGCHRLTVTQMAFSPNSQHLLSVSRDRTWAVFTRTPIDSPTGFTYTKLDVSSKKETMHARVIWSCAWLPDSAHFITGSRDKTVAVWGRTEEGWTRQALLTEQQEVTAVAVTQTPALQKTSAVAVAIGFVSGEVYIRTYSLEEERFSEDCVKLHHCHHDTVRRLQFMSVTATVSNTVMLASCGNDCRVQIYEIKL